MILRRVRQFIIILGLSTFVLAMTPHFANENQQQLYEQLTQTVRCLVCQNQSVADSSSPFAGDIRQRIAMMVSEGKSAEQIEQILVEHYGEKILFRPANDARMWLLWYGPFVLMSVLGIWAWARRQS